VAAKADGQVRQATIFVVEDDQDVLVSLRFLLETEGFNVRTFSSGPALLAEGLPGPQDCLVVDYKMAEMDGFELIERLRGQRVSAPVVLVTAYPGPAVTARAESTGVRHIVLKPHIEDSLIAHVRAAIGEARPV
jgi:FixJ family two-component response regulator